MQRVCLAAGALLLWAATVHADEVHLEGGRVIEGASKVEGDRVIVALESGKISLPLRSVVRIEQKRPASEEARQREARIRSDDIEGLLALADYCREHDLRAKEHELLQRVLRVAPDHELARHRLGYVRAKEGWITGAERARRERADELDKKKAELAKQQGELELDQKKAELTLNEARLERERAAFLEERARRERERDERVVYPSYYVAPIGPVPPALTPPSGPPAFPINGVRSPSDMSFSIPGVREPRTYFGDALRR